MKWCWEKPNQPDEEPPQPDPEPKSCRSYTWLNDQGELMSRQLTEYECQLEDDVQSLQDSLFSISSHYAKIQFRLRQITTSSGQERMYLLRELERVVCQGIDANQRDNELPSLWCDSHRLGNVRRKQRQIIGDLRNRLKNLAEVCDTCFCAETESDYDLRHYWPSEQDDISRSLNDEEHERDCKCIVCREQASAMACKQGYLSEIWDPDNSGEEEDDDEKPRGKKKKKRIKNKKDKSKDSKSPSKTSKSSSFNKSQSSEAIRSRKRNSKSDSQRSNGAKQENNSNKSRKSVTSSNNSSRSKLLDKEKRRPSATKQDFIAPKLNKLNNGAQSFSRRSSQNSSMLNPFGNKINHMTLPQYIAQVKQNSYDQLESQRSRQGLKETPRGSLSQASSKTETSRRNSRNSLTRSTQSSHNQLEVKKKCMCLNRGAEPPRTLGQQARTRDAGGRACSQSSRMQCLGNVFNERSKSCISAQNMPRAYGCNVSHMRACKSCHSYEESQQNPTKCPRKSCLRTKPTTAGCLKQVKYKFNSEPNLYYEYSDDTEIAQLHATTNTLMGVSSICGGFIEQPRSSHIYCHYDVATEEDSEKTEESEMNEVPEKLKKTAKPEVPERPKKPEKSKKPKVPEKPKKIENPEKPEVPEKPTKPEVLEVPEKPKKRKKPEVPEKPQKSKRQISGCDIDYKASCTREKNQNEFNIKSKSIEQLTHLSSQPITQLGLSKSYDKCKNSYPVYPSSSSKYGMSQKSKFGRRFCKLICATLRTQVEDQNAPKKYQVHKDETSRPTEDDIQSDPKT